MKKRAGKKWRKTEMVKKVAEKTPKRHFCGGIKNTDIMLCTYCTKTLTGANVGDNQHNENYRREWRSF